MDDTDRDSSAENNIQPPIGTIEQASSIQHNTIDAKDIPGLDTSRFGDSFNPFLHNQIETTYRSNLTTLSYFIDPKEHIKTLKSPIRDKLANYFNSGNQSASKSRSRSGSKEQTHRSSALVVEKSPVKK